ncbi:hypothetical protein [Paenibacillus apiarius]|uniref:Uncharacterized protein n=1 Tax=Paenibacillus apiarius TaxID=46240 RepID=A0ABT4DP48_9BACL|nr:hypothetical protein [Paenibacillus apiarius]MCY9514560.1 hypothetical protein [Paenibacillus apiarius]MCY9518550.1 hypothetical protein [Paenibacillus apiarius]MCY9552638.1 hypothetical protein [Paenibacillus apiarius]MCY9557034.1 hypothetical protein [Paenibacillus apiarius]MCY9686013.1 hypothetical protein [Paenibacillus apiarius]
MFKKWSAFLVLLLLLSAMAASVCTAASDQSSSNVNESKHSTQRFYLTTDPVKNQDLIKSYGNLSLNDNISYFLNSSTYASSDYTLLNSSPTQEGDDYSNFYGVVRLYKAKDAGKHKLYVLEQVSTASGITKDSKSSGISQLKWTSYYSSEGGSISLNDWSPKGTTKQKSTSSFNWAINPSIEGVSVGSIGGSFQLDEGLLVAEPSTNIYSETWTGDPVVHPAHVAQEGATAWFVKNGDEPGLQFWWQWNWSYSYWH